MSSWIWWSLIIIVVLFALLYWSGKRFSPEEIARNTARTMLAAFYATQKAHPELEKEELYVRALNTRPTFRNESTVKEILGDAKQTAEEMGQPIRLWMVTVWVVMHEYHSFRSRTSSVPGKIPHALEFYDQFLTSVRQVIPDDI